MHGGFWQNARKMGRAGFHADKADLAQKLKKEGPQQLAQNRDKLKKDKAGKEKPAR